ncbi:hypothetical protein G7046_g4689 [Stylonectria norvegica]|nr:hypothetical protein G7046_g4689 [Stylonectria norvegica]
MPRARVTAALAGLVDSDSEPDLDCFDAREITAARSSKPPMTITKKPRGRPAAASKVANKVTKPLPKKPIRRTSGRIATAVTTAPREALADRSNAVPLRASRKTTKQVQEDVDDLDMADQSADVASAPAKPARGRPKAAASAKSKQPILDALNKPVPASTAKTRGRPQLRTIKTIPDEIPETQPEEAMELDITSDEKVDLDVPISPIYMENTASFDMNDISLRRRLGELTAKYESLEMRHRDLREVGVKEAERNFERLRKQAEERTAAASKLVAELKEELAAQTELAKQSTKQGDQLRKELEASDSKVGDMEATIEDLNGSLTKARAEIKTLSTKLSASRSAEANGRVPGSALKVNAAGNRTAQAEAIHTGQAKEDLYGDLTGLIMRGVKRDEKEDVFDCIQTGRNGTLHFKLAVESADASDSYDDIQLTYRPQLDSSRDGDLIDVLPDYLVEEITFPRPQASRFYARVIKSLTEPRTD